MPSTNKEIAIIILAAGASTRMGKIKQLLPYKNTTLLGHTILTANSCGKDVFTIVGAHADEIKKEVKEPTLFLEHSNWEEGLGSTLSFAISSIGSFKKYKAILILLADQPLIDKAYILKMIETFTSTGKGIVATEYEDGVGVPAIFDTPYFPILSGLKQDEGAKHILQQYKKDSLYLNGKDKTLDVDTVEDYNKIVQ